jgi:hypothetical protein
MTKDQYFEMCETLGSEPLDEEIPVELEDLPEIAQQAFSIYETLQDEWEYMNGNYVGKKLTNLFQVLDLYEVPKEEHLVVYKLLVTIDSVRRNIIREKSNNK